MKRSRRCYCGAPVVRGYDLCIVHKLPIARPIPIVRDRLARPDPPWEPLAKFRRFTRAEQIQAVLESSEPATPCMSRYDLDEPERSWCAWCQAPIKRRIDDAPLCYDCEALSAEMTT